MADDALRLRLDCLYFEGNDDMSQFYCLVTQLLSVIRGYVTIDILVNLKAARDLVTHILLKRSLSTPVLC